MTSSHFLSFVTCLGSNLGPRHSLKWHLIATSWHFMTAHTAYYLPQIQSEVKVKITHDTWIMTNGFQVTRDSCSFALSQPQPWPIWTTTLKSFSGGWIDCGCHAGPLLPLLQRSSTASRVSCQRGMGSRLEAAKGLSRPVLSFGHVTWFTFGTCFCIWSVTGGNTSDYTLQNADPDSDAVAHGWLLMSGRMAPVAKEEVDCDYSSRSSFATSGILSGNLVECYYLALDMTHAKMPFVK